MFFSTIILFFSASGFLFSQTSVNPVIKDYGTIYSIETAQQPNPSIHYKLVIDFKTSNSNYQQVNKGLNNIARMLNLYGAGGVPKSNVQVAVAIHNVATPVVLTNEGYNKKYGINNPNLDIIAQLEAAGVKFYVCGQSMVSRGYNFSDLNPTVTLGLSMLTISTEYMMKGYSLLTFE